MEKTIPIDPWAGAQQRFPGENAEIHSNRGIFRGMRNCQFSTSAKTGISCSTFEGMETGCVSVGEKIFETLNQASQASPWCPSLFPDPEPSFLLGSSPETRAR